MKIKFPRLGVSRRRQKTSRQEKRNLRLETLEDRSLLTLLGIASELDFPVITYNGTGEYSYEASSGLFSIEATPLAFKGSSGSPIRLVTGADRAVELNIIVDNSGDLVGGVPGDDFVLTGEIDLDGDTIPDVSGTLLTGEITAFGYLDTTATKDDFDFRFTPTGGELLTMFFSGQDIGVTAFSENSNFAGSFEQDFGGVKVKGNIGAVEETTAMLGNFVWHDLDADGIQDEGEPGIEGVKVVLTGGGEDGIIGSGGDDTMEMMLTDSDGLYKFNDLNPGEQYQVTFENPDPDGDDAYMFSPRQVGGDPAIDSDAATTDIVTLLSGEYNDTLDAGLFRKGSIHVFGYLDEDGDGNFDEEDGAFPDDPGKTFELFAGDSATGDALKTETTVDGMVWFTGLTPGEYTVRENPVPDGYKLTTLPNVRTFTITSGEELVYEDGAAMLPDGDQRYETNLGDQLRWGNKQKREHCKPHPKKCGCSHSCDCHKPKKCDWEKYFKKHFKKHSKPSKHGGCGKYEDICKKTDNKWGDHGKHEWGNHGKHGKTSYGKGICEVDCVYAQWGAKHDSHSKCHEKSTYACGDKHDKHSHRPQKCSKHEKTSWCKEHNTKYADNAFHDYGCEKDRSGYSKYAKNFSWWLS